VRNGIDKSVRQEGLGKVSAGVFRLTRDLEVKFGFVGVGGEDLGRVWNM